METIGILGLFFGLSAFVLSVYSIIKIKAWELSTHRIEYLHDGGVQEMKKEAQELIKEPKTFDNLESSLVDDFDIEKSGL